MSAGDVTVIAPVSIQGDDTKPIVRAKSVLNGFGVMNTTNRDLIHADAKAGGYVVYNTTTSQLEYWNASAWVALSGGGISGIPMTFFASTVDGDPTAGGVRLSNATPASATSMYVDDVEASDGTNIRDLIASLANTVGAQVRLQSKSADENWIVYRVGGYTSASGYGKLTGLTVVDSSATVTLSTAVSDTILSIDVVDVSGYRPVATASARTGMPTSERQAGMLVRENDTGLLYVLAGDLTTWVLADTSTTNQKISHASADAVAADLTLRKARGTETSPAAVNADDGLGTLTAQGHDGSAYYDAGRLSYLADAAGGTSKRTRAEQQLHDGTALVITESAVPYRVTTTDATLTVIKSIALAADSVLRVRYGIVGSQSASSNRAIRETSVTVRRSGSGDPVVVAYGDAVPLFKDDATWGADTEIGHQINTSTDALEIIVKGKASTDIVWRVDIVSGVR